MPNDLKNPKVSVILAVFNGEDYIKDAIDSILRQTYSNFELIIIDDGSKDNTVNIIKDLIDPRIKLIEQENRGLAASLNRAIEISSGKFIARQDHDDLSLPTRLEKQVRFLEENPEYAILGTHSSIWVENVQTDRGHKHPIDFPTLNFKLLFDCFFVHSSVMIRKSALDSVGHYTTDPSRQPPEDFELWSRVVRKYKVANLSEPLLIYRELPSSITRTVNFKEKLIQICSENLAFMAQLERPNIDTWNIAALYHNEPDLINSSSFNFSKLEKLLRQIAVRVDQISPGGNATAEADILLRQFIGRIPDHLQSNKTKFSFATATQRIKTKIRRTVKTLLGK
jgi:glycosyltransferase involved in cell wall biosynthesis